MACIPGLRTNCDCNFVLDLIAWVEAYYITKTEKNGVRVRCQSREQAGSEYFISIAIVKSLDKRIVRRP